VVYACALILRPFVNVIAWSSVLAITFYPVYRKLEQKTGRASLSAFVCSVLVVVIIVIPFMFMVAVAVSQLLALRDYLQQASATGFTGWAPVQRALDVLSTRFGIDATAIISWVQQNANALARGTAEYSLTIAASVTTVVISFVFTIFAMFLLFRDGDRIVTAIEGVLPFERSRSRAILANIRDVIYASVYGVVVIALLQGALCGVMFWLLGIPSAVLWGMLTVITSVLPIIGAATVWVPGTIYLLLTGQWISAIVLAIWGAIVISSVDNFFRPKLVGGRVGLSELVMFFALLGGLQVFGVLGIVLGPVLFAIAASIVRVLRDAKPLPGVAHGNGDAR
jgi:predicted PurR-regulated permease PerM